MMMSGTISGRDGALVPSGLPGLTHRLSRPVVTPPRQEGTADAVTPQRMVLPPSAEMLVLQMQPCSFKAASIGEIVPDMGLSIIRADPSSRPGSAASALRRKASNSRCWGTSRSLLRAAMIT